MASGTSGNITWNLDESTGVLTLSGSGTMNDYSYESSSRAPWYSYRSSITSIVINSGITSIGNYAFYYQTNATSISIPDSVTSIGEYAFYQCTSLTSVTIPNGVTSIGYRVFNGCKGLTSVTIPNGVTSIGEDAFYYCTSLTSVTIPDSVTSIGYEAFSYCTSLTSITFEGNSAPTLNSISFALGNSSRPVTATVYTKGGWGSDDVFTTTVRGSYTTFVYEKLVTANVHINVSGTWKESTPYVNVNGTWKEVVGVYVNVNGTWKEAI